MDRTMLLAAAALMCGAAQAQAPGGARGPTGWILGGQAVAAVPGWAKVVQPLHQGPDMTTAPMPEVRCDGFPVKEVDAAVCHGAPGLIRVWGYVGPDLEPGNVLRAGARIWLAGSTTPAQR